MPLSLTDYYESLHVFVRVDTMGLAYVVGLRELAMHTCKSIYRDDGSDYQGT